MRKVIGIGETVLDIIFKNENPIAAKPGGSTFNAIISLGRMDIPALFITETGNDKVGNIIIDFLKSNGVDSSYVYQYENGKSAISLAFLDENQDASYTFYKDPPKQRIEAHLPEINKDDIIIFGSYFALNPILRPVVKALIKKGKTHGAIIYYDPNFRSSHLHQLEEIKPALTENIKDADIVRGSNEDFKNILKTDSFEATYKLLEAHTPLFIYTRNKDGVDLACHGMKAHYDAPVIKPLSTIGAGDNFNAGVAYALIKYNILKDDFENLSAEAWEKVIKTAMSFSQNVCESYDNYISTEFAKTLKR